MLGGDGGHEYIKNYMTMYHEGYKPPTTIVSIEYCVGMKDNTIIDSVNDSTAELFLTYKISRCGSETDDIYMKMDEPFVKYDLKMK